MIELEINLRYNGKILYGLAELNEREFHAIKSLDRWDMERFLRQKLVELGHGLTDQIYLQDRETVVEEVKLKGKVEEVMEASSADVTKLIESLPILNGEGSELIGNSNGNQEG